jgi:plastocyanin
MREDIRERVFTPFLLPAAVIGVMLLIGISLSRVLLAVSEFGAALVALLAAGYIMGMAFFVQSRRRIPGRALGVALAVGLIGLVGAGAVASAAGMRSLEEESAGGGEQPAGGEDGGGGEEGANEPLFVAIDIEWEQAPQTLPPGDIDFTLENQGGIQHTVVLEELGDEKILDAAGGQSDEATVTLEAGEYTYYCDVAGHRATMEGTLTIEEGAPSAEGGGGSEASSEPESSEGASEPAGASESER